MKTYAFKYNYVVDLKIMGNHDINTAYEGSTVRVEGCIN